ncbi:MAG TPA: GAF domain-containing protein [Candidatus Limnocylindrales bacterium]|nr:GAF domain-containing protein [Candidatus Limnocylindrales bacterium]
MTDADRSAALEALVAVAARLAAAERLAPATAEPALRAIADAAAVALHVTAASIALHDVSAGTLVFRAAAGPEGEGVIGVAIAAHEGIAGYVFSTGQPLAIADVAEDPRFERGTAERTGYVPRSLLAVPLVDDEGIVGVMEWLDRIDGAPFDLVNLDVATRVAAAATATARATGLEHDAGWLLVQALAAVADRTTASTRAALEPVIAEVAAELADHDALWRLADRIGRLRDVDPDDVDLAAAFLDALLAHTHRGRNVRRRA